MSENVRYYVSYPHQVSTKPSSHTMRVVPSGSEIVFFQDAVSLMLSDGSYEFCCDEDTHVRVVNKGDKRLRVQIQKAPFDDGAGDKPDVKSDVKSDAEVVPALNTENIMKDYIINLKDEIINQVMKVTCNVNGRIVGIASISSSDINELKEKCVALKTMCMTSGCPISWSFILELFVDQLIRFKENNQKVNPQSVNVTIKDMISFLSDHTDEETLNRVLYRAAMVGYDVIISEVCKKGASITKVLPHVQNTETISCLIESMKSCKKKHPSDTPEQIEQIIRKTHPEFWTDTSDCTLNPIRSSLVEMINSLTKKTPTKKPLGCVIDYSENTDTEDESDDESEDDKPPRKMMVHKKSPVKSKHDYCSDCLDSDCSGCDE